MKEKPKFMLIYRCIKCGLESGYTELDAPSCRYCDESTEMTLVSKDPITPELMANRLKTLADNMMKNLQSAYETFSDEEKQMLDAAEANAEKEAEAELMDLMVHAEKLKQMLSELNLKDPPKEN